MKRGRYTSRLVRDAMQDRSNKVKDYEDANAKNLKESWDGAAKAGDDKIKQIAPSPRDQIEAQAKSYVHEIVDGTAAAALPRLNQDRENVQNNRGSPVTPIKLDDLKSMYSKKVTLTVIVGDPPDSQPSSQPTTKP